jgi:hypothetical protein
MNFDVKNGLKISKKLKISLCGQKINGLEIGRVKNYRTYLKFE